jgi:hypothetical protein
MMKVRLVFPSPLSFLKNNPRQLFRRQVGQGRSEAPMTDVNQPKHNDGPRHLSALTQVGSNEKHDVRARGVYFLYAKKCLD